MASNSVLNDVREKVERETLLATKRVAQWWRHAMAASSARNVIFIAGVQRSGTNMIADVLERSFDTDVFLENDPRSYENFQLRPAPVLHRLVERSRARHVVFKALCETQSVRAMLDDFAPARAVWCVRHYADMTNSHLRKWSGCTGRIARIADGTRERDWRDRDMSPEMRALVRRMYRPDLNDASAVALFWYFRNMTFFEQGLDRDDRVIVVRYERLVADPVREFERLCRFFGLTYRPRLTEKVHSRSVRKAPPPDICPDIATLCDQMLERFAPFYGQDACAQAIAPALDHSQATRGVSSSTCR